MSKKFFRSFLIILFFIGSVKQNYQFLQPPILFNQFGPVIKANINLYYFKNKYSHYQIFTLNVQHTLLLLNSRRPFEAKKLTRPAWSLDLLKYLLLLPDLETPVHTGGARTQACISQDTSEKNGIMKA